MIHLGDITKIHGDAITPVDIITGGSPCQDLSVAGKRAGLAGERSGLFMEQMRIIKEMRRQYGKPRFMVWENVPGAFSSNKGEDFRAVLEETAHIVAEDAVIPGPPKGKWQPSGCIMGDGWSIAWRVHDAQFWGVPQRRKRISLVADFGGGCAPEILFERKSVSGDTEESGKQGEGVTGDLKESVGEAIGFNGWQSVTAKMPTLKEKMPPIEATMPPNVLVYGIGGYNSEGMKSGNPHSGIYEADTARTLDLNGGTPACNQGGMAVVQSAGFDGYAESEIMYMMNATERHAVCVENHPCDSRCKISEDGMVQTLSGRMETGGNNVPMVMETEPLTASKASFFMKSHNDGKVETFGLDRAAFNQGANAKYDFSVDEEIVGAETIFKWGVAVLDALQQANVLQQGVHESGIYNETENRQELDGSALPCPSVVAGWLLRNMRQRGECGRSSQGRESSEQQFEQFTEVMPELSQQNSQTCKDLFDMWSKGEGIGLLQQTLHQIQEIRRSIDVPRQSIVRRLTPLEAERLQGFPDGWTDIGEWVDSKGKKHKDADSPRYKALGNSIALPFWIWMAARMRAYLPAEPTMGSLFDGIGGFVIAFEKAGVKAEWASEIEEFCIAVTKKHFSE